jgi:DNA (cytosine-5)-methyltransferase 1
LNGFDLSVNELFSGIGAQKRGIDLTGLFNCKVISTSDIDKDVMVSYAAIHCGLTKSLINTYSEYPSKDDMAKLLFDRNIGFDFKNNKPYDWYKHVKQKNKTLEKYYLACILADNLGDISRINTLPYADLWTYSFPCTDISVAGKQEGIVKGKTRSGLLYEVDRLLDVAEKYNTKPKFLLLENVKNLVGKQFKNQFDDWINRLSELGYNTYWKVVNGKDCGIPQNRERTFAISIRKDIDKRLFEFMKPFDGGLRLKDLLDITVDEKYYISNDTADKIIKEYKENNKLTINDIINVGKLNTSQDGVVVNINGIAPTHTAGHGNCPKILENNIIQIGNYRETSGSFDNPQTGRVYSPEGISPTLNTMQGGDRQPKVLIKQATKQGFIECNIGGVADLSYPESKTRRGRVQDNGDTCPTITAAETGIHRIESLTRIRKLTPTECFRLMGFNDDDIRLCMDLDISDSQLYKEAGNSIITYCIMLIMEHLYKAMYSNSYICTDERILNREVEDINFKQPSVVNDCRSCAMRGRYNDDKSTTQQLEIRRDELSNTITTVQKDSLVVEL